jgi:DNA helicase-2/ATP-dependent DNA helicase PcrA
MNPSAPDLQKLINSHLNDQQRTAVLHDKESLLIIAGAGSGKTQVITTRIAHLIANQGAMPHQIIALTFTNKAAGEMRERLHKLLAGQYGLPFIGTFHGYCLQILRNYPQLTNLQQFSILDADDQQSLIKKIMKQYALAKHITASQITYAISKYKNRLATNNAVAIEVGALPMMKEIYIQYEAEKVSARCLDFDDIILRVLEGLKKDINLRTQLQSKIRHILVDEYQDTSDVQHQLLLTMATKENALVIDSMCAVGDEDQSIYSWRGATVANMLKFQNDFAPVTTVKIEQNYRSVQPILEAANSVIANNTLRNPKELWSTRAAKNRILHLKCGSGDQEADAIATVAQILNSKDEQSQIAILYRTHYQSRTLEEALIHKAIPYKIIGGIRFYERKEVKDLLAYLKIIVNPYDKISLLRIINVPSRGLGEKFEEDLLGLWQQQPFLDFKQLIDMMLASGTLSPTKTRAVEDFLKLYSKLNPADHPTILLHSIIEHVAYFSYLTDAYEKEEAHAKQENVQEFIQALSIFEQKQSSAPKEGTLLENFLHEVALLQESSSEDEDAHPGVLMMTLHAAKGLEFDTVILAGLEEGLLPSQRSLNAHEYLEEERRLMYVGMTRAKNHLLISSAHTRYTFGQLVDQAPSRFLQEIQSGLMQTVEIDGLPRFQTKALLEQWLNGQPITTATQPASNPLHRAPASSSFKKQLYAQPQSVARKTATTTRSSNAPWYKNQTVKHQKFGAGIVTDVEKAPDNDFYVTAIFKDGKKKILSKFLGT